jgi:hypothetical protein
MAIRISIEVDEDRLRAAGKGTTDAEVLAAIEAHSGTPCDPR